jgi:hypothetical protein
MNRIIEFHRAQRGGAGVKLLLVLVVIVLAANAGFNYVPVAYSGQNFKQEMQTAVVNGTALPVHMRPLETVKSRLRKAAYDNSLPQDAVMDVRQVGGAIQAYVSYTQKVSILPFGIYNYNYQFTHTATPTGFLMKQ